MRALLWISGVGLTIPLVLLVFLLTNTGADSAHVLMVPHFWIVGLTAFLATASMFVVILASPEIRETRMLFFAAALLATTGIFVAHALTTPGAAGHGANMAIHASASISLLIGSFFIALSAVRLPRFVSEVPQRLGLGFAVALAVVLAAYAAVLFAKPSLLDNWPGPTPGQAFAAWPEHSRLVALLIGIPPLALIAFALWRYLRAWRLARLPSQWAHVVTLALLFEAQIGIMFAGPWRLAWWLYHGMLLAAFVVLIAGWLYEWRRSGTVRVFAEAMTMREGLDRVRRGYPDAVPDLMAELERKDAYTRGHAGRVAEFAYAIGRELQLDDAQLRRLALMAEVHDIGKIGVPDSILLKPGSLTADEFTQVKAHTQRGWLITHDLNGLQEAASGVRHHHERLDGRGYPDGLAGDELPVEVRCLTAADVFDALTTTRSYRPAMNADAAFEIMQRDSGAAFDPACVEALRVLLARGAIVIGAPEVQVTPEA